MTPEIRLRLYRDMLRLRVIEEHIAKIYPEQEMRCPVHLYTGQEAVAVGVSAALGPADYVMSGHRSHGHYLAKGGDLDAMIAEIYGRADGCSIGNGGSMHLIDLTVNFLGAAPIVGSTIPIAVGAALAAKMRGEDRVSVIYFGDAAAETGVFHESLNYAMLHKLPVIFVCENNLFSVCTALDERQPEGREIYAMAAGHGIEAAQIIGDDVETVYEAAAQAVARTRAGAGPSFLEIMTYRWREHVGPEIDDEIGYRDLDEVRDWRARCPIKRLEDALIAEGHLSRNDGDNLRRGFEAEIAATVARAKSLPYPAPQQLAENIYAP